MEQDHFKIPAAALDGVDRPDLKPISFSRLGAWSRCTAAAHLRYDIHADTDYEAAHFVVGKTIHSALEHYYKYEVESLSEGIDRALTDLFAKYEVADALDKVRTAASIESGIINRFTSGEIVKPNGDHYSSPRMTKRYKELAEEANLPALHEELQWFGLGKVKLPEGGLVELVERIESLAKKYESTIMIPREQLEEIWVEQKFDFLTTSDSGETFRILGFMDLVARKKPEFGGKWILIDYKTGRAQTNAYHQASADTSLQVTLYEYVLHTLWGIPKEDLEVALHYLDAAYPAVTSRPEHSFREIKRLLDPYKELAGKPGLIKRHFYDGGDCGTCEYRSACIKHFDCPCVTDLTTDGIHDVWG